MKFKQHGERLWQLTWLFAFNCYLVKEDEGLTLVDSNLQGSGVGIARVVETIGLPVTRITLTHTHNDHAGSLDEVSRLFPEAEVTFTRRAAEFLQGNLTLEAGEPQTALRGGFVTRTTPFSRPIAPGDMVGSLRVVAAPGHTPDQVAFLDERDGTLIAGDAFQTQAGIAVAGIRRWLFPFPAMATWHLPTALESAMALRQLDPSRLAVGHGRVLDDPGRLMDKAIAEAWRSLVNEHGDPGSLTEVNPLKVAK